MILSTIKEKATLIVVGVLLLSLVLICSYAFWVSFKLEKEKAKVGALNTAVTQLEESVAAKNKAISDLEQNQKIESEVQSSVSKSIDAVLPKQKAIDAERKKEEEKIIFVTPANEAAKKEAETKLSLVRIRALWKTYCNTDAASATCNHN